jgi:SAM-dependent methyltransferase
MTTTTTDATTTTGPAPTTVDPTRLEEFVGRFATDFAATMHGASITIGHKLGLYRALAEGGPATGAELAERTGLDRRLVEEWCNAQYVSGYAGHDAATGRFHLTPEQAACLADPTHPSFMVGAMVVAASAFKDEERVRDAFHTGQGLAWGAHHDDLFTGTELLFRPGYVANLVESWIPALDGVDAKLRTTGGRVADLGCGHGASTLLLAASYPAAQVTGYDSHAGSIEVARQRAAEAGLADRVRFAVAGAGDFPGTGHDLVCTFDALHDMGDPLGAARHVRRSLADDGTWLVVEPMAGEGLDDNVNPVGRIFYSVASFVCAPHAQSEGGATVLGNQVPDHAWRDLLAEAGFGRFRRATETPFNRVFEARP